MSDDITWQVERRTNDLILDGDSSIEIYHNIEDCLRKNQRISPSGPKINKMLNDDLMVLIQHIVDDVCELHPNYELRQKIKNGKLLVNKETENKGFVVFNPLNLDQFTISARSLSSLVSGKRIKQDLHHCKFDWNPYSSKKLDKKRDGSWEFNQYQPAKWIGKDFYKDGFEYPKEPLPEIYRIFLMHLVNGDKRSFDYILSWLAQVIQPHKRNFCILTTIGQQGVGKGLLGQIMRNLVGVVNFSETSQKAISGTFNKQLLYKLVVYINEIEVKTIADENRLKGYIDEMVEIEAKHQDAITIQNHASLYISTNNEDALRLTADDRRFSIVTLTKNKMIPEYWEKISGGCEITDLLELKNIKKFGNFLMNKKVNEKEMTQPLKTLTTEEIRRASLKTWEDWTVFTLHSNKKGEKVTLEDLSDLIEQKFGSRFRPTKYAFSKLVKIYPERLVLKSEVVDKKDPNNRLWYMYFIPQEKD